eukprot:scaffold2926_cov258-Alexandrium_tamarense.AAC.3
MYKIGEERVENVAQFQAGIHVAHSKSRYKTYRQRNSIVSISRIFVHFNLNLKTILVSHHDNITGRQCHGGRRYDSPLREEASGPEMMPNGWCPVQIESALATVDYS